MEHQLQKDLWQKISALPLELKKQLFGLLYWEIHSKEEPMILEDAGDGAAFYAWQAKAIKNAMDASNKTLEESELQERIQEKMKALGIE